MAERKVFDIAKHVPLFGLGYRAIRGLAYAAAGDEDEASHSVELDVADLNPIRSYRNVTNGVIGACANLSKNMWLGKRTLGISPVGLTLSAGFDLFHWGIQIDGVIYELLKNNGKVFINIVSKDDDPDDYEALCKRFDWSVLAAHSSYVSKTALYQFAKSFEAYEYEAVLPEKGKLNCQLFVILMLTEARQLSFVKAMAVLLVLIPNLVF